MTDYLGDPYYGLHISGNIKADSIVVSDGFFVSVTSLNSSLVFTGEEDAFQYSLFVEANDLLLSAV